MRAPRTNRYGCPVPDDWMYFDTTTLEEVLVAVRMGGVTEEQAADGRPLVRRVSAHAALLTVALVHAACGRGTSFSHHAPYAVSSTCSLRTHRHVTVAGDPSRPGRREQAPSDMPVLAHVLSQAGPGLNPRGFVSAYLPVASPQRHKPQLLSAQAGFDPPSQGSRAHR